VVGVWVGFDDHRSLGDREAGASAALPIWIEFMRRALEIVPDSAFPIPDNIVFARVDPRTGMLAADSTADATAEVFVKGTEPTRPAPAGSRPTDFFHADSAPEPGQNAF
jgi:penicillin-binding protein 1A